MEYIFQQESVSRDAHPLKNVQDKKKKNSKKPQ
jgi:hypothetical protein